MLRTTTAALLLALVTACAGTAAMPEQPLVDGPPIDPGHGGVDEVVDALAQQGVPCTGARRLRPLPGTEEAMECLLGSAREKVLLLHFVTPRDAREFYAEEQAAGRHGTYALTWAARTATEQSAALLASAVRSRAHA